MAKDNLLMGSVPIRQMLNGPYIQNSIFEWKGLGILMVACFAAAAVGSSCAHTPVDIEALGIIISASVNWDDDPEPDGIQFAMRPQDADGFMVKAEGITNAKLWSQPDFSTAEKGRLIQEWNRPITKKDYTKDLIARIRLEYDGYIPRPGESGILELMFTTPDGKSFSFEETNIRLAYYSHELREQPPQGCCP